jgi:sugar-specific transcriptional regulator TrmB
MPKTTTVLDEARELISKRLSELDEERGRLERALGELGQKVHPTRRGRGPGRPRGSSSTKKASPKRRRRKGGRADQAVALIEAKPGISAAEVATELKIKPNYVYRVLGDLGKEGRVKKKGRQYYPGG